MRGMNKTAGRVRLSSREENAAQVLRDEYIYKIKERGKELAAQMTDTGPRHPVWDGAITLDMTDELNQRAQGVMIAFYLGQGFCEAPEWQEIGDDFRFGFRSVVRYFDAQTTRAAPPHSDTG